MRIPIQIIPAPADCTIPLSDMQKELYKVLKPHYKERVEANPGVYWIRDHYKFICKALELGLVHSNNSLAAEAMVSD